MTYHQYGNIVITLILMVITGMLMFLVLPESVTAATFFDLSSTGEVKDLVMAGIEVCVMVVNGNTILYGAFITWIVGGLFIGWKGGTIFKTIKLSAMVWLALNIPNILINIFLPYMENISMGVSWFVSMSRVSMIIGAIIFPLIGLVFFKIFRSIDERKIKKQYTIQSQEQRDDQPREVEERSEPSSIPSINVDDIIEGPE